MAQIKSNSALTFKNEGSSDPKSHWYTRNAHWPGTNSGVTLGKGYDMKLRKATDIEKHLIEAGMDSGKAKLLSGGAGLSGENAKTFVKSKEISAIELTEDQEIKLFNKVYGEKEKEAIRICTKTDVVKKYGACDWSKIDPGIKEFVVDLIYRGDYTPGTREKVQKAIVSNDYDTLINHANDRSVWAANLDGNRFDKRIHHLKTQKTIFNLNSGKASNAPTK